MLKTEFVNEMHQELDQRYKEFMEYQDIVWDIFREFHCICEKNEIQYYLAFGSLLGFIRDGDMIPWDSDIDVLLPIDQLDKLITVLKTQLGSNYYYVTNVENSKYPNYMSRICKKGYNSDIVHLDILYLIGAADSEEENQQMQKEIQRIISIREEKLRKTIWRENGKIRIDLHGIIRNIRLLRYPLKTINARCFELCNRYSFVNAKNYITFGHGAEYFPAEVFEPRTVMTWREGKAYLPGDYNRFLTIRYGDFQGYLPISDRFDEFTQAYKEYICYGTRNEVYNK